MKVWTIKEEELLVRKFFFYTEKELEELFGFKYKTLRAKMKRMYDGGKMSQFKNRKWSKFEDDYIMDSYGTDQHVEIAKVIFRTEKAVKFRIFHLIGDCTVNSITGDYINSDLQLILGKSRNSIRNLALDRGLPFVKIGKVYTFPNESFWNWVKLEENHKYINATGIDFDNLYCCPNWYKDLVNKLKRDIGNDLKRGDYSEKELTLAWSMINRGCTYKEIGKELNRPYENVMVHFGKLKRKIKVGTI